MEKITRPWQESVPFPPETERLREEREKREGLAKKRRGEKDKEHPVEHKNG